jgi:hypothetical protein
VAERTVSGQAPVPRALYRQVSVELSRSFPAWRRILSLLDPVSWLRAR